MSTWTGELQSLAGLFVDHLPPASPEPSDTGHVGPVDKAMATNFWTWSLAEMIGTSEAGVRLILGQFLGVYQSPKLIPTHLLDLKLTG